MFKKVYKNISALILAGLLIFISCSTDNNHTHLPKKLGELNLTKVIQNKRAAVIINKMHGKKLDDCKNFIAIYGNNHSKNILYVSVYEKAETAETNIKNMAMKMANGSSVFSPLTHTKMGDNVYFETEGMGLKHYLYRTDNISIWWQVEPDKAVATFNDLFKFDFAVLNDKSCKRIGQVQGNENPFVKKGMPPKI
ncbi:MAG: hypothetical protein U9N83_05150 [Thermodesulfobacteriota bacterium]|nr:hypothetical protein [Thermodesulfobacteriota bacterium]